MGLIFSHSREEKENFTDTSSTRVERQKESWQSNNVIFSFMES